MKTWIASSNDIKDKEPLLKARRDIETVSVDMTGVRLDEEY